LDVKRAGETEYGLSGKISANKNFTEVNHIIGKPKNLDVKNVLLPRKNMMSGQASLIPCPETKRKTNLI
jgi:hypothetical protein